MNDITFKEANEILSHYTDLGYGIVIEGEDTSKIKQALSLASKALTRGTPLHINVPSANCISRVALIKAIKTECNPYGKPTIDFESGKKVLKIIDNAPTVEPICPYLSDNEIKQPCLNSPCERPQGEWVKFEYEMSGGYRCSNCENIEVYTPNFCPNCGADMRTKENSNG